MTAIHWYLRVYYEKTWPVRKIWQLAVDYQSKYRLYKLHSSDYKSKLFHVSCKKA